MFASVEFTSGLMQAANMNAISVYVHKCSICTMQTSLVAAVCSVPRQTRTRNRYIFICMFASVHSTHKIGVVVGCCWAVVCIHKVNCTRHLHHCKRPYSEKQRPCHCTIFTAYICVCVARLKLWILRPCLRFIHSCNSFTDKRSHGCTWHTRI